MRSGLRITALGATLAIVACGGPPPSDPYVYSEKISSSYQPSQSQRIAVMGRVASYWGALKAGRWGAAYEFLTLDYREAWPFTAFQRQSRAFNQDRRITQVHWLKDSPRMPGPELFAVVEWTAGPADAPVRWGRMVWREQRGSFLMQSAEESPRLP